MDRLRVFAVELALGGGLGVSWVSSHFETGMHFATAALVFAMAAYRAYRVFWRGDPPHDDFGGSR